ncbi:hypothetical protein [Cylindrospermum sp. FACHB-282]|uniref:hypothetical protein n=1 Tax=Cylindrospermum sp. FACHB-282 TaxID=2692794 RepID=UPI001F555CF7|nr:hypothetical protein [Cylindrospermum sp. FACHB-282]
MTLVFLVLLVNLMIIQPSWAERKYTADPDYIELTQKLESALQQQQTETSTPELQQKISDLKFQKYILETSKNSSGVCRNQTEKTLLIYGQKSKKSSSTYDNELYLLPSGAETDDEWDCQGVYIPGEAATEGKEATPARAFKIVHGTILVATSNPQTGETEFNVPPANVFKSGEANWLIPDNLQVVLESGITTAKIND